MSIYSQKWVFHEYSCIEITIKLLIMEFEYNDATLRLWVLRVFFKSMSLILFKDGQGMKGHCWNNNKQTFFRGFGGKKGPARKNLELGQFFFISLRWPFTNESLCCCASSDLFKPDSTRFEYFPYKDGLGKSWKIAALFGRKKNVPFWLVFWHFLPIFGSTNNSKSGTRFHNKHQNKYKIWMDMFYEVFSQKVKYVDMQYMWQCLKPTSDMSKHV